MPAKPAVASSKPRQRVATVFREAIAKAEAEGVKKKAMTLHLTLADDADLRRDRSLPLTDIRFSDGVMHYLDVKVVRGGVTASALQTEG
jgi:hypothetical protein